MLQPAILYEDLLLKKMIKVCWFNEKYKYFNQGFEQLEEISQSSKDAHQFVSVDNDGNICGIIFYRIDRHTRNVCGLNAASFDENAITFGRDLLQAIDDIFVKFGFNKLNFGVVIGNPIEKTYDRLVCQAGGRVSGYYKRDAILMDGTFADVKVYEIMKEEYLDHIEEKEWRKTLVANKR